VLRGASIHESLLAPSASVAGSVEHSVIERGAVVEHGAVVRESVVLPGAVVRCGAEIVRAVIDDGVEVCAGATVGEADGEIAPVGLRARVPRATAIRAGSRFPKELTGSPRA
jgi:glucose-1-phosphate adenylyltransferase